MERETSVASDAATTRQARIAFWAIGLTVAAIKLFVANALALFGDEAFYWQESRQLAWSYTDVPPATAWLIRLGETLFGHSLLGVRSLFLLLGTATVVLGLAGWAGAAVGAAGVAAPGRAPRPASALNRLRIMASLGLTELAVLASSCKALL